MTGMRFLASFLMTLVVSAPAVVLTQEGRARPDEKHLKNVQQLTFGGENAEAYFSPEEDKLIIFSSNLADPKGRNFDLFVINVDGTGLERITTDPSFDGFPMFTRDGKKLVFASNRNAKEEGETNIFIADWIP